MVIENLVLMIRVEAISLGYLSGFKSWKRFQTSRITWLQKNNITICQSANMRPTVILYLTGLGVLHLMELIIPIQNMSDLVS